MMDAFCIDWMPAWLGLAPTGWIMMMRGALAPPVLRTALTHASRYTFRSVCVMASLPLALCGSLKHSSMRWLSKDRKAVAIWAHTAVISAATAAAAAAVSG